MGLLQKIRERNSDRAGAPGRPRKLDSSELPEQLLWLADAPLFIDDRQVEAFYDATLQPDYEEIGQSFGDSVSADTTIGGDLTVGAVFPPLTTKAATHARRQKGHSRESGSTWNRVTNPYRHLIALVLRYATEEELHPRLVFADANGCVDGSGQPVDISDPEYPRRSPRAMIMLDLAPGTQFIPAALELTDGTVVPVFKTLAKRLEANAQGPQPEYRSGSDPASKEARHKYWDWFREAYDRQQALEVIEESVSSAAIAWIAYRIPFLDTYPHLHLAGRGHYETGVFGYQFLARGERHGLRIVGMVKSEPDINVLAVFER